MGDTVEATASSGSAAPARQQVLADMPWDPSPKTEAKESEAAADAPKETASTPAEPTESAAADDLDGAKSEMAAALDAKPKEDAAPADKRLDTIAKAEKRSRDLIAKERTDAKASFQAEVEQVKSQLAPQIESARKFETAKQQARTNPVELMRSLGLSEDDFEYAAQQLYNHSKAAASDPKRAQAAAQARREREKDTALEEMRAEIAAIKAEKAQSQQTSNFERQKAEYLDGVTAKLPAEAPLLKKLVEKSPAKAKAEMWKTAERIFAETGEVPDAEDLATAYEKQRRAELEELGVDVASVIGSKATAPVVVAPEAKPAKTLDPAKSSTTAAPKAAAKESDTDRRARLLKDMPWDTGTA